MTTNILFPLKTQGEFSKDQLTTMFPSQVRIDIKSVGCYCWTSNAGARINTEFGYDYVADIEIESVEFADTLICMDDGSLRPVLSL